MKKFKMENINITEEMLYSKGELPNELDIRKSIIGDSKEILRVWNMVERFAQSDVTILLEGETGTGKELFARAIHQMSDRRNRPFCPIDCSSLPETLLESEIFGYEKGTFTGATERKPGRFELANGGTIFLDEVSNFSNNIQTKLLRVIQERKFYPLGTKHLKPMDLDCRIIAASNQSLSDAKGDGKFREDLFYRLSEVTLNLPPLRNRRGDIKLLAEYFVIQCREELNKTISGVSASTLSILDGYHWPGNVRELENVIRYSAHTAVDIIMPWHLPDYIRDYVCRQPIATAEEATIPVSLQKEVIMERDTHIKVELMFNLGDSRDLKTLTAKVQEEVERKIFCEVLKKMNLNKSQMARFFGIDCKTLRVKLKRYYSDEN